MKRHRVLIGTVTTVLLVVATGLTYAQGPGPLDGVDSEASLGTAFTYQGRLDDADGPVDDTCDLTFKLYDAAGSGIPPSGGTLLGTEEKSDQPIKDGYFTVQLDFGSGVFTGEARWLEIQVDCGGGGVTLSPRQALTAAPYALYAPSAGAVPWGGISGVPGDLADGDDDTTYSAGAGLSLTGSTFSADTSYLQRRVGSTCGSGNAIRVINADGTVTCEPDDDTTYSAGAGLSLTDTSFSADTSYLQRRVSGTCDAGNAIQVVHDDGSVTCEPVGNGTGPHDHWGETWSGSGVGLTLQSDDGDALHGTTASSAGHAIYGEATDSGDVRNYGGFFVAEGERGRGVYGRAANPSDAINYGGFFYASGVQGRGVFGQSQGSDGVGVKGWASDEGDVENYGGHFTADGKHGRGVYGHATYTGFQPWGTDNYGGYFEADGTNGVGVYGKASNTAASVNYGGYFVAAGGSGIGVYGEAPVDGGHFIASDLGGAAVYGEATLEGDVQTRGGHFISRGDQGRGVEGWATSDEGVNYGGYFSSSSSMGTGVYGRATDSEAQSYTFGVFGESNGVQGRGVYGLADGSSGIGVMGWASGSSGKAVEGLATNDGDVENYGGDFAASGERGIGVKGWASGTSGTGVYALATGTSGTGIFAKGGSSGYAADFQGNVILRSWSSGSAIMELGEGLDYAEGFDVSEANEIGPGTVLVIDADNPGKLTVSDQAYDTKVAGIVAGGQAQGSGVRLGVDQFDHDVALAGRVYCNVDASDASIAPGDLLTTSTTPGYAMKATDYERAQGAVLGKAMERLEQGKRGQILVLVTLQ